MRFILSITAALLAAALPAQESTAQTQDVTVAFVDAYPLETCVVSGRTLNPEKTKTFEAGDRTFKTCCTRCQTKVEKDPATFATKLDAAVIAAQSPSYPLTTCPISDRPIKKARDVVVANTLVRVCCKRCAAKVPEMAVAVVGKIQKAALRAQSKAYPLKKCVVSNEPLTAKHTDVMYGSRLVRVCSDKCATEFQAQPAKYLAKMNFARSLDSTALPAGDGKSCCSESKETPAAKASCCSEKTEPAKSSCCSEKAEKAKPAKKSCCSGKQ